MKKLSLLTLLLLVFNLNAQTRQSKNKLQSHFKVQMEIIMETFKTKKVERLNSLLVNGYTIRGIPKGMEAMALPQIFEQMPSFNKYVATRIAIEGENKRVFINFIFQDQKIKSNIVFNKQGKIKELNLLEEADVN